MRHAFVKALCEIAQKDERIFLITADLGFNVLEPFREKFPKRFLNIGVAEANLITVAAGLSTTGHVPFVYSIATFATMRPFEQIRCDISLHNANVKIIGIGGGLAYSKAGPTHHSFDDIALLRTMKNMVIVDPCSQNQTYEATKAISIHKGPVYMRIEHDPDPPHSLSTQKFRLGEGEEIKKGKSVAIMTTGTKLSLAISISHALKRHGIIPSVCQFSTINPIDTDLIKKTLNSHRTVVSIEEHSVEGGLGSIISDQLATSDNSHKCRVIKFGLNSTSKLTTGSYDVLMKYHGLSKEFIVKQIISHAKG